jgi:serine/threonine-protein kinase
MIGSKILHYQVTEKLGEGGMGEVFLAEDTRLHRRVALKFLNQTFREDQDAHDRLVREARAASQLSQANIVAIHAIEETDDHLFIAMEYVEGQSLRELIKSGAVGQDRALDFARQILVALSAAHDKDIVHRDIKSDNIKVTSKGQVKVLDFGLARSVGATEVTRFGSSVGTPAYMSPEQVQGETADHRSDLFSLGVVFFEMLTGHRPFKGKHESALTYSIVNEEPDVSDVPAGLQTIMNKLLAKNREQRYQSAADVLTDLDRMRAGSAPAARPTSKGRWALPVIAGVAVVAMIIVAAMSVFRDESGGPVPTDGRSQRIKLVVLPFENLGPTDHEYFADGITEEVTTRLAKISDLGVISRKSAMKYKDSDKSLKDIGTELDVEYALEGTIRWEQSASADRVRINTQLIRVSDDTHLWAERFERVYDQIFELESEIAENVAEALNVTLLAPELAALKEEPTENFEAYDFYLKGRDLYHRAEGGNDRQLATGMIEKAVQLDSTYSLAHALLARIYTNDYFNNLNPEEPRLQQGRLSALAAQRQNPDGPEGHVAMGYYHYYGSRDYENALREFEVAKSRDPNNADVLQAMGYVQRRQGNWDEAYKNLRRALELEPTSVDLVGAVIRTATFMRRYQDADRYIEHGQTLAPGLPTFGALKAQRLMLAGDFAAAQAVLDEHAQQFGRAAGLAVQINLDIYLHNYEDLRERVPDLGFIEREFGVADSANYYLIKGLSYDLENGMENESEAARAYYDSARAVWQRQLDDRPDDPQTHGLLAQSYAGLRDMDMAFYHAERAVELMPLSKDALTGADMLMIEASIQAAFGDVNKALDTFEFLLSIPSEVTPSTLEHNPLFFRLHDMPRFKDLIREKKTL